MTESVFEIAAAVRERRTSAVERVSAALDRVERFDKATNAFCAVDPDIARADAEAIDKRIASGDDVGLLAGVPIGVKDHEYA